jgi:tRNA(Ile)-lysidine synthase
MSFGAAHLRAVLEQQLPQGVTGLLVGVSGGADSACLLAALSQPDSLPPRARKVRAVHIDHGLQAASVTLRESAAALCARFATPLQLMAVDVACGAGISIEAAARASRYAAIATALAPGECLLTAHHQQDQAETLLLQLMRGTGLKGLAAMPACKPLGRGWHVRPLLDVAHADLLAFGRTHGVTAADDPMNHDPRFDRAYVRGELWTVIEARWPGAATALSRTARHLAEAQSILDESAARQLARLRDGEALRVAGLRALSRVEQINTLRHFISSRSVEPPASTQLREALRQILSADSDHLPVIAWREHALRRYRDRVFLTAATPPAIGPDREWPRSSCATFELAQGLGRLRLVPRKGGLDERRLPERLVVRQRRGGEALKLGARGASQSVKHLCQLGGVLPWMRSALPLLYAGEALIAIGDLWQDARWRVGQGVWGLECVWADAPDVT